MFHAIVFCLWSLIGVFGTESESVTEGDPVTLNIDFTRVQGDDHINLKFGRDEAIIAAVKREKNQITLVNGTVNERIRGRLKLDENTESLTITNTRITDSGLYKLTSKNDGTQLNIFNITVYAHLPVPLISSNSSKNYSSSGSSHQNCSFVCSVLNVSHVTLSWYAGISVLSSISVCDLSISLSLHLEIQCLDGSYSCVLNNPISKQTTHLNNTQLCHTCADGNQMLPLYAVAAGALLILVAVGIFWICRKQRKTNQEVQSRAEDITYADPTFYKRKAQKSRVKEEDDVVYAGVAVRR